MGALHPLDDEYYQFFEALAPRNLLEFLRLLAANPTHVLLDPLSTWLAARLSESPAALRFPSVLFGLLGVYAAWRLQAQAGQSRRGLAAAALLAFSLAHADWSRRADFYALAPAVAALHAGAFLELLRTGERRAYAAWSAVFLYSHPYSFLALALHAAALPLLGGRRRLKGFGLAWLIAGAAFLPWFACSTAGLAELRFDFSEAAGTLSLGRFVARAPLYFAHASETYPPLMGWAGGFQSAGALLCLSLYAVSLARTLRGGADPAVRLAHLLVPFALVSVPALDAAFGYFLASRQLLWTAPFYLGAVAHGAQAVLESLERSWGRPAARASAAAASAALGAWAVGAHVEATRGELELASGHRRLVEAVARAARPGDTLEFQHDLLAQAFLFDFDRSAFLGAKGLTMDRGHILFVGVSGLTARRDGADLRIRLSRADEPAFGRTWRVSGTPRDLYVSPPAPPAGPRPVVSAGEPPPEYRGSH